MFKVDLETSFKNNGNIYIRIEKKGCLSVGPFAQKWRKFASEIPDIPSTDVPPGHPQHRWQMLQGCRHGKVGAKVWKWKIYFHQIQVGLSCLFSCMCQKPIFSWLFHVNLQKTNAFGKRRLFVSAIKLFMLFHGMSNSHKVIKSYADFNG